MKRSENTSHSNISCIYELFNKSAKKVTNDV